MSKKHLYFSQMKLLDTFLYLISTTIYELGIAIRHGFELHEYLLVAVRKLRLQFESIN